MKSMTLPLYLLITLLLHGAAPWQGALAEPPAKTKVVTLEILGMATPNCPVLVKTAVGKMAGVEKVEASLKMKHAKVTYRPTVTTPEKIRKVIKDQVGFDSKIVKDG